MVLCDSVKRFKRKTGFRMWILSQKKLGGGINRMKHHLAGMKEDTDACTKVPADV